MKFGQIRKPLALLALTALAACGGSTAPLTVVPTSPPATGPAILTRIVGVGDSLTAGYQSGAFWRAVLRRAALRFYSKPLATVRRLRDWALRPASKQGSGSVLRSATGVNFAFMSTPTVSPLPLIGGPGSVTRSSTPTGPHRRIPVRHAADEQQLLPVQSGRVHALGRAAHGSRAAWRRTVFDLAFPASRCTKPSR